MVLCPHCGKDAGQLCECRLVSRRRFFAGFGLAVGGALVAPKLALRELAASAMPLVPTTVVVAPGVSEAVVLDQFGQIMRRVYSEFRVNAFPVLSPLLSTIIRDAKPRSLFEPPPSQVVYWDVELNAAPMPRIVRDYRCPRGSFVAFERFVERQYGQA